MNPRFLLKHRLINMVQLYALFLLLSSLIVYIALVIGGEVLAVFALFLVVLVYLTNPYIASTFILRMYNAQHVPYSSAPALYDLVEEISSRAELAFSPKIYYTSSGVINSFTVGRSNNSIIVISDGVLRALTYEEIAGVIAHEISHIKNKDIRVMMFADIAGRILKVLSFFGQIMILLSLPLLILTEVAINWLPFIIIAFAPVASDLIQLGLSRVREYEADVGSAMLLGDARPLASALKKIDFYEHNYFRSVFYPIQKIPDPSLLRTHPKTEERIRRLMDIQSLIEHDPIKHKAELISGKQPYHNIETKHRIPRRHLNGFWY